MTAAELARAALSQLAGPVAAVIVGLLFAAIATLTLGMPAGEQKEQS